jgi:hypothetical protein
MDNLPDPYLFAAEKYKGLSGDASLCFRTLCLILSDHIELVEWNAFNPEDWGLTFTQAKNEGVAPLLYWKMRGLDLGALAKTPSAATKLNWLFERCQEVYFQTLANNTLLYQELTSILNAFQQAGIPLVVLKGAALAITVYDDIGLRPMGDLDLLVQPSHLERAISLFKHLGYQIQRIAYHVALEPIDKNKKSRLIELHWSLPPDPINHKIYSLSGLWSELVSHEFELPTNVYGQTLSPVLSYLYLIAHSVYQHGLMSIRLIWYHDLSVIRIMHADDMKSSKLDSMAKMLGWHHALVIVDNWLDYIFTTQTNLVSLDKFITNRTVKSNFLKRDSYYLRKWVHNASRILPLGVRILLWRYLLFPSPGYIRSRQNLNHSLLWYLGYLERWNEMFVYYFLKS